MERRWDKSKPPQGPFTLNRDCPQARGLVAWYPMGGASGRTAVLDLVGKAHLSGTTRGGTLGEDGRPALTYSSGSSDSLASSVIVLAAYPCTIAGWYRQTSAASAAIACMSSTDGAAGHGRKLLYAGSNFTVRAFDENSGGGAQAVTTAAGSLNRWAHGAAVFASSTSRTAYSNGASPVQDTTDTGTWANGQDTRLGSDLAGNLCTGDIGEIGFWNVALDDGLIYRLYDPSKRFELWYPLRSRKWFVPGGGGDVSVALTGQSASAAAGALGVTHSNAAAGQAATAAAGTLAPSVAIAIAGSASATSAGTLTATRAAALAGQQSVASAGTLAPTTTLGLTGQSASAAAGTVTPLGDVTVALSGQAVTASAGTASPAITRAASGQSCAATAGAVLPAVSVNANGTQLATAAGTLTLGIVVPLAGLASTAAAGTVIYSTGSNVTVALSGQAVAASAGALAWGRGDGLSASPIGHGPAVSSRSPSLSSRRGANLSTRIR